MRFLSQRTCIIIVIVKQNVKAQRIHKSGLVAPWAAKLSPQRCNQTRLDSTPVNNTQTPNVFEIAKERAYFSEIASFQGCVRSEWDIASLIARRAIWSALVHTNMLLHHALSCACELKLKIRLRTDVPLRLKEFALCVSARKFNPHNTSASRTQHSKHTWDHSVTIRILLRYAVLHTKSQHTAQ